MNLVRTWLVVAVFVVAAQAGEESGVAGARPIPAGSALDARALTERIDATLAARCSGARVRPAGLAEDGEFLRRVSLDLIGKIPTAAEARDFLDDPSRDKRLALVERLLDSPAYVTRATELWRQLLLPESESEDQARRVVTGFEAWLRRKVAEEAGYDRIVRELLTVKLDNRNNLDAPAGLVEPSPAAYYAAKENKPENLAAGVARVFLGVRLECAQCHDHPFAQWKREQFWGFAAFFAGVPDGGTEATLRRVQPTPSRRELTIPGTKKVVQAAHLDHSPPAWRPRAETRDVLAEWITAPENPYFARAVVNRVWARFFGVGLVEPVDDLELDSASEYGPLLDELAVQFRRHNYDLKYLIRVLTATRAYNLASAGEPDDSSSPMFAHMPVRGLSAQQFFDSLTRATGLDDVEARARFLELFANREERSPEAQTSILQALTLMNGTYIARATSPETGDVLGAVVKAPFLDTEGRIESLYLATLSRRPRPEERALLVQFVDRHEGVGDRAQALSDVFWSLLNGPEFHLNH